MNDKLVKIVTVLAGIGTVVCIRNIYKAQLNIAYHKGAIDQLELHRNDLAEIRKILEEKDS